MKGFLQEFKTFAMRGSAIDLAVGVVIGAAFNQVIAALANNILTPPIGLLMGNIDFAGLSVALAGSVSIRYGVFLQALVNFIITALALFIFIKVFNKLASRQDAKPKESPELAVLREIRDRLKERP